MKADSKLGETGILAALNFAADATFLVGFSQSSLTNGQAYARRGQVLSVVLMDAADGLIGSVLGTAPKPYTVEIVAHISRWSARFSGRCSCPVGQNCKHAAALILHASQPEIRAQLARSQPAWPPGNNGGERGAGTPETGLSRELAAWVSDLRRTQEADDDTYPPNIRQRLIYVLKPEPTRNPHIRGIGVDVISARLLKDDSFSATSSAYGIHNLDDRNDGKFIRPCDREILPLLSRLARDSGLSGRAIKLTGARGAAVLPAILRTGRARWDSLTGPPLTMDEAQTATISWGINEDGSQSPLLVLPDGYIALRLAPPWFIDPDSGRAGPVRTDLPDLLAETLLSAPRVSLDQAAILRSNLARDLPKVAAHAPPAIAAPEQISVPMRPVLRIETRKLPRLPWAASYAASYNGGYDEPPDLQVARAAFRYGVREIAAADPRIAPHFAEAGKVIEIIRDRASEAAALQALTAIGFVSAQTVLARTQGIPADDLVLVADGEPDGLDWLDFFYYEAPRLRDDGWDIILAADFPIRLVHGEAGALAAELRDITTPATPHCDRIDWFELDLGVMVDGEKIDLLPALIDLIGADSWVPDRDGDAADGTAGDEPFYLPLRDGRVLALSRRRIMPILQAIHDLLASKDHDGAGGIRLSRYDAGLLAEFEVAGQNAGMTWSGGESLRRLGRLLGDAGGIEPVAIPENFQAHLRPYQARGVDWLQFLRAGQLAGILADEMGLGKTVQALAHIAIEQAAGRLAMPVLVVAPTSLVANWQREAERFAPILRVLVLHGADRAQRFSEIPKHDLVISTYPLLARDHAVLHAQLWHMVVLDEAQIIKNPNALTSRLMRGLNTGHRLCLTGTPLENNLGELWSLFAFLAPDLLGDRKSFQRRWRTPIEKQGNTVQQALLARYVRPFMLRRTKAEVASELPPKTEIVETIGMAQAQRDLYEGIRLTMHMKVRQAIAARGLARSHIVILEALLRLRQACCDPRLLKLPAGRMRDAASAKLDRLREMLPELVADGRHILIFSQFTSMLKLVEDVLANLGLHWVKLTGETRDRQTPIARFQNGEVPIFLISLKAGGVGLNLTAADTVIHYDPWWNPAVEDQATDRAHRIGQHNPVFVHRLVIADSVEEKMEALKSRKRALAEGLFDATAGDTLNLNEADVQDLFS